jgi:glycosyltransferase involved in cell wall biosynthesis
MQEIYKPPLISVIINCYNGEKFLQDAIDSVYSQTYSNWEIIFWDNASTDGSAKIAKSYDRRLKYFYNSKNTVLGLARINAIESANGEYLAFLDCDDLWNDIKLETQVDIIRSNPDASLIYSKCEVISGTNQLIGKMPLMDTLPSGKEVFGQLAKENFIPFVSALISKKKYYEIGGFPAHFKNSTDYYLFLKLSFNFDVIGINKVLCKYREHSQNLSHFQHVIGAKESIESVASFYPDLRAIKGIKYQYLQLAIGLIKEKNFFNALYILTRHRGWFLLKNRILKKGKY